MSYSVALSDVALDSLSCLEDQVAQNRILHQINLQLADNPVELSSPATAPYPTGRLHQFDFSIESVSYYTTTIFRIQQAGDDRTIQVLDIHIKVVRPMWRSP